MEGVDEPIDTYGGFPVDLIHSVVMQVPGLDPRIDRLCILLLPSPASGEVREGEMDPRVKPAGPSSLHQ